VEILKDTLPIMKCVSRDFEISAFLKSLQIAEYSLAQWFSFAHNTIIENLDHYKSISDITLLIKTL